MKTHVISFDSDGSARCVYTDDLPLAELGRLDIKRASTIEYNAETALWDVRLGTDIRGPVVFSDASRARCIEWEVSTIQATL